MTQPLFDVVVLHHAADSTAAARVKALQRAFEIPAPETDVPQFVTEPDPWTYVNCAAYSDPAEFERRAPGIGKRALFVILVTEKMVEDPAWQERLNILASALPRRADQGTQNALCFATSEAAQDKLPGRLRERQAPESSVLGERRLRPHTLALLALHRARLLLGAEPNKNKLTLFISHAKADGLFLAHSLRSLIQEVPELEKWYDADDIQSGEDWSETIEAAAANSVLVAIRTEGYEQSASCRREFETALVHGVPIVVVDALWRPTVAASSLPFAAMPTVRIPDGNTHRVLAAALREHLRLLLVETLVAERVPKDSGLTWRVWPRLPTLGAIQRYADVSDTAEYWLIPQALQFTTEFNAARDWLAVVNSSLRLESVDGFLLLAGTLGIPHGPSV